MEDEEKANWGQVGYWIIAFSAFFLIWGFFIDAPSYGSLERVQGALEKNEIIRIPQGVGTRWLYIRSGDQQLTLCMLQLVDLASIEVIGKVLWILGVSDFPCDYQIWEIGSGDETIVS